MPYWPGHANFILMKIGNRHRALVEAMRRREVLVRDRTADPGCDGCVRITLGTLAHTQKGMAALESSLKEIAWHPEN